MAKTRNTRQKAAVLAAVKRAKHHPDAKWVYEQVSREIPNISLGTVYRALASLSAEGLIREYRQADGPALYDPNIDDHLHIHCSVCGRIEDVPPVEHPSRTCWKAYAARAPSRRSIEFTWSFDGLCSACAAETAT